MKCTRGPLWASQGATGGRIRIVDASRAGQGWPVIARSLNKVRLDHGPRRRPVVPSIARAVVLANSKDTSRARGDTRPTQLEA